MYDLEYLNNSEIIINSKESNIFKIYIVIILIFLIGAGLLITLYKYEDVLRFTGFVNQKSINLSIKSNDLKYFDYKNIVIDDNKFNYKISKIDEVIYKNNIYYNIVLNLEKDKILESKDIVNFKIVFKKETLYKKIIERVKRGF